MLRLCRKGSLEPISNLMFMTPHPKMDFNVLTTSLSVQSDAVEL